MEKCVKMDNILQFFSPKTFREGQREAIEDVEAAFNKGSRFVILECPTGLGKSHIGATFARYFKSAHIVTVQKILQDQYSKDFGDEMFIMKGRGAYTCLIPKEDGSKRSCAIGLCKMKKNFNKHSDCPYTQALEAAQIAGLTVHNFDSFYYQSLTGAYKKRNLLLIDEAHNIENKFLNFIEFSISNKKDKSLKIPKYDRIEQYDSFLTAIKDTIKKRLVLIKEIAELTQDTFKEEEDLERLLRRIDIYFNTSKTNEFVFDYTDHKMYQTVTFKPLFVSNFVKQSLFKYGDRVLMMSATILNKTIFCNSIGINPEEATFISTPSYFPIDNRPIVKDYVGLMSYKKINETLPNMVTKIKAILEDHPEERGIIHTVSEYVANYIKSNIRDSRLTFRKDFRTVNDMLLVHKEKLNSFIVASGLKEGLDLHGDLSRVQVIMKVPYLSLGDKRVKRRLELNKSWYGYMATLMFIQSIGRSVRSAEDKAITYILDKDFERFYGMNHRFFPEYIKEAIMSIHDFYDIMEVGYV